MRLVATFAVGVKQAKTLRDAVEAIAPQVHLLAPIIIQEHDDDEQVPRSGQDEAWPGGRVDAGNQAARLDDGCASADADGDRGLAGDAGEDSAGEPEQQHADNGQAGAVPSEEGRAVSPQEEG